MARKTISKNPEFRCLGPSVNVPVILNLQKKLERFGKKINLASNDYKILSGHSRIKTMLLLRWHGPLCVCDLADIMATTPSAVSHQLAVLKKAGLVKPRKRAKTVFYRLTGAGKKALQIWN